MSAPARPQILRDAKDIQRGPTLREFLHNMQPVQIVHPLTGERAHIIRVIWEGGGHDDYEVLP